MHKVVTPNDLYTLVYDRSRSIAQFFDIFAVVVTYLKPQLLKKHIWHHALYTRLFSMDIVDAIEVSKNFPTLNVKVFKGFAEWGICDTETEGYVVLADLSLVSEPCLDELEDYTESRNMRIDQIDGYLMICTPC